MREPAFHPGPLEDPAVEWRLLFPRKDAPVLDRGLRPEAGRRLGLVLLDGSWSQCAHMGRRLRVLSRLPCVSLPPGPPSFWTVRAQHHENHRSTFEAALRALELLEGPAAVSPLREAFALVTAAMLHLKGRLPSPDVPATWGV
jgi:DTW domain-containing protein YfiP